jgi:hypothetical protein
MKWLMAAVIVGLWAGYMMHEDRKRVPHSTHIAIHALYLLLALAVIVWL